MGCKAGDILTRLEAVRSAVRAAPRLSCGTPVVTLDPDGPLGPFLDLAALLRPKDESFEFQYLNPSEAARCGVEGEWCGFDEATPSGLRERLLSASRRLMEEPAVHCLVGVARDDRAPDALIEAAGFSVTISVNGRGRTHVARFFRFAPAPRGSFERLFHDSWEPLAADALAS